KMGQTSVHKWCRVWVGVKSNQTSFNEVGSIKQINTYLLCSLVGSLSVLIMCGNLLLITSIIYFKQLHTPTNYLILSLAVADLLVGVVVLPFTTVLAVSSCWYLEDLLCKVRNSFDAFLCTSSILNLCSISVDRYYAVCQPLRYKAKINVCVILIMILVSWTAPALNGISMTFLGVNKGQSNRCVLFQNVSLAIMPIVFGFYFPAIVMVTIYLKILMVAQRQACSIHNTTCQSTKSEIKKERKATKTLAIVMGVFLISIVMVTIYLKILMVAQRQAHSIHNTTCQSTKSEIKKERKATKTLAIVMGVFLMCWTPFTLSTTFNPLSNYTIPAAVIAAFKWLGWSNSMLNPLVYAFFYRVEGLQKFTVWFIFLFWGHTHCLFMFYIYLFGLKCCLHSQNSN
uniref:G-protein coupled receptors family 1 profile domain-containing protein n=1 Tax=Dicentrarchus labrax TaxID=13489 RepID=A0A8P4GFS7_DICLA